MSDNVTRAEFERLKSCLESLRKSYSHLVRVSLGSPSGPPMESPAVAKAEEEASVVILDEKMPAVEPQTATSANSPNVMPEKKRERKAASKRGVSAANRRLSNRLLYLKLSKK